MGRWSWSAAIALAAVVLVVPALAGCGDDDGDPVATGTDTGTDGSSTTSTSTVEPTSPAPPRLWPADPATASEDPVDSARAFADEVLGVDDPLLSEFLEGEPGAGEVELRSPREGESGSDAEGILRSTLSMREHEGLWLVTSASSSAIEIDRPEPVDTISSPVTVEGRGRGFEGTILLELRLLGAGPETFLVREITIGGALEELLPFTAAFPFDAPSGVELVLLAYNEDASGAGFGDLTAIPLVAG
jgi:hypothetical protein